LSKRKLIIISTILSAVVLALFVLLIVLLSNQSDGIKAEKYDVGSIVRNLNEKNVSVTAKNISVIAESESLKQGKNTYLSVKSAVKNNLDGIMLDVAFRNDGTPVLAENFNDVKDNSTELKKVFELIKGTSFKLVLNMGEVSDMNNIRELIDSYDMKGNVMIMVDDEVKMIAVKRNLSNYKVCIEFNEDGIDFKNSDEMRSKAFAAKKSGASYIAVKPEYLTKEFIGACNSCHVGAVAYGANTNSSVQKALSEEIDVFITDCPNDVKNIISSLKS